VGLFVEINAPQQEDLIRLLVASVKDYAILLLDPHGYVRTWNEGAQRIKGYRADEIIGQHFSIFYEPAEVRRGKPDYVLRIAADEGQFEEENWRVRKDGTRFWANVAITALRNPEGELLGFAKVTRDLSERKQAEEDRAHLLELERAARTQAERALERLQAIQLVTEAALAHLNLESLLDELLDRILDLLATDTVAVLLLTEDEADLVPWAARGLEEEVELGIHIPVGHGFAGRVVSERRPIILDDVPHADVVNPLLHQKGLQSLLGVPLVVEGRITGVLHVGTMHPRRFTDDDVSSLQIAADRVALAIDHARLYEATERARQEAESAGLAVRMRDEFLSVAAHELKTPVTGLRTAAQVLVRQIARGSSVEPSRLAQMADVLDHESAKLAELVNQLLDLSRLEAGKLALDRREIDLVPLIQGSVARAQAHAPNHQIEVLGLPSLYARIDPLRIEQVLVNLVDNAIKYSPSGGEIEVEVTQPDPTALQVAVRDQGIGLAAEHRDLIFDRFYQVDTTERGTGLGLGLYISKEIVERHGGQLWAESRVGGGTIFVMTLPMDPTT
jgi:PAS domain S-box-containing protein